MNCNTLVSLVHDVSRYDASCRLRYLLRTGGRNGFDSLNLLQSLSAIAPSWDQASVYQVVGRAAAYQRYKAVDVGGANMFRRCQPSM